MLTDEGPTLHTYKEVAHNETHEGWYPVEHKRVCLWTSTRTWPVTETQV